MTLQKAAGADADFRGKDESQARLSVLAIDPSTADAGTRAALDNYLRREPNDPAALARVAQLQLRDGKPDQAIKTYERIIADNPLYAPATRQLAILSAEGATDAAKAYDVAQKARQTYPNDPEVAKALGILSYRREIYPRSVDLLTEASAKRKDDPELLYYLGAAHYQLKQWNACKVALEHAVSLSLSAKLADEAKRALAECTDNSPQPDRP